jgi:Do/DeqQ family serine protease
MARILFSIVFALFAPIAVADTTAADTVVPKSQREIALGFAPLVRDAAPAVVNIYAQFVREESASSFARDPFFSQFFDGFGVQRPAVQNSLGSGVILSADGIVVSNYHVVGMATDIRVVLTDRREFTAELLLADEESDLAILRLLEADNLPYLELRDSDSVEVGELTLAIGNPFGVGQTVTSGIISGLARSGVLTGQAHGYFLQTDAAINPGNSGGALIDINGDLIGINTAILSRSGGSNGIGFAIPANLVSEFKNQARRGQRVFMRPWAGMSGQPVDQDMAMALGMLQPYGMVISDLHERSPFAASGLKVGDIIVQVDGLDVNAPSEMIFRMSTAGIGKTAEVHFLRDGALNETSVDMIPPPEDPPSQQRTLTDKTALPGLAIARINPAVIVEYGLPLQAEGALVVDPGRLGARAGLKQGDVIMSINGTSVATADEVAIELVEPGRDVQMDVLRQGRQFDVRFRL